MLDPENSVYGEKNRIKKYYRIVNLKKTNFFLHIIKKYITLPTVLDLFLAHENYDI